jgi:hypothetical protein
MKGLDRALFELWRDTVATLLEITKASQLTPKLKHKLKHVSQRVVIFDTYSKSRRN